jgi:hypothetical protein
MNFDYMATGAATLYLLGIYLHYIHVKTIFHLLDKLDEVNKTKALFHSTVWPITVLTFLWQDIMGVEDD